MDQGGELFNHPKIKNIFTKSGYRIYPTGADASNQNGPVKQGHRTIANTVHALLTGSSIHTTFWLYLFYHTFRLHNAIPTRASDVSPLLAQPTSRKTSPISGLLDVTSGYNH